MKSNFIDHIKFYARSGHGGAGSVHFRREKHVPKGGPDGGDGGKGGSIILKGNAQLWTLIHLKFKRHIVAKNGESGQGSRKSGVNANDVIIEVPLGTVVKDAKDNKLLMEILEDKKQKILLEGGKGGLGNFHYKSDTNQTPRYAQPGIEGIEKWIILELKILADVGLVGFPNAGKSTFLSVVSAAKPKIANYPFTTLEPNLGVVKYREHKSFVVADIPGIIEGAASGKGLGLRFLRHIERNSILLFMVSVEVDDVKKQYHLLLNELKTYNPELLDKKRILIITKEDLAGDELKKKIEEQIRIPHIFFSNFTQNGLMKLKDKIWEILQ